MPTATGAETIGERLTRLRTELSRVRDTLARAEGNGASFAMGGSAGTQVTEISYERALKRRRELEREIGDLERRLAGGTRAAAGFATTKTVMES